MTGNVQFPDNPSLQTVPDPNAAPVATPPPPTDAAATPPPTDTAAQPPPDTPQVTPPAAPVETPAAVITPADTPTETPVAEPAAVPVPPAAPPADRGDSSGSMWDAANRQSEHLTPQQIAQLNPGSKPPQAPGTPGLLSCSSFLAFTHQGFVDTHLVSGDVRPPFLATQTIPCKPSAAAAKCQSSLYA